VQFRRSGVGAHRGLRRNMWEITALAPSSAAFGAP
jgi:hypothetical protein